MAHAFFESLLAGGVGTPKPGRGRFRSYLLGALKHFLSKHRAAALAGKSGGGAENVHLATETAPSPSLPLPGVLDDALALEREWAITLIGHARAVLESEHAHKSSVFTTLKPWLDGGASASQAAAAHSLSMTETAVKVAIHRLRVRFRELIRAEIAATVNDPVAVAEELRHLISSLSPARAEVADTRTPPSPPERRRSIFHPTATRTCDTRAKLFRQP